MRDGSGKSRGAAGGKKAAGKKAGAGLRRTAGQKTETGLIRAAGRRSLLTDPEKIRSTVFRMCRETAPPITGHPAENMQKKALVGAHREEGKRLKARTVGEDLPGNPCV